MAYFLLRGIQKKFIIPFKKAKELFKHFLNKKDAPEVIEIDNDLAIKTSELKFVSLEADEKERLEKQKLEREKAVELWKLEHQNRIDLEPHAKAMLDLQNRFRTIYWIYKNQKPTKEIEEKFLEISEKFFQENPNRIWTSLTVMKELLLPVELPGLSEFQKQIRMGGIRMLVENLERRDIIEAQNL